MRRKIQLISIAVVVLLVVSLAAVFTRPAKGVCGGIPEKVDLQQNLLKTTKTIRSVYAVKGTQTPSVWVGFLDGGLAHYTNGILENCDLTVVGQKAIASTVNAICEKDGQVFALTDGAGLLIIAGGKVTLLNREIAHKANLEWGDDRLYGCYISPNSGNLTVSSWDWLLEYNQGKWKKVREPKMGVARQIHTLISYQDTLVLGPIHKGKGIALLRATDSWEILNNPGISLIEFRDSIIMGTQVALVGDVGDSDASGIVYVDTQNSTVKIDQYRDLRRLTGVAVYNGSLVVTDWTKGAAMLTSKGWQKLTDVPSFDVDVDSRFIYIATSDGLLIHTP